MNERTFLSFALRDIRHPKMSRKKSMKTFFDANLKLRMGELQSLLVSNWKSNLTVASQNER